MKQSKKTAAVKPKVVDEDHDPSSTESPQVTETRDITGEISPGNSSRGTPTLFKKIHDRQKQTHPALFTTAAKARAPGRTAGLAQEQRRQCRTRQTSPRSEGALEQHSWELGCSSIQWIIISILAYRFVSFPLLLLSFLWSTLSSSLALVSMQKSPPFPCPSHPASPCSSQP